MIKKSGFILKAVLTVFWFHRTEQGPYFLVMQTSICLSVGVISVVVLSSVVEAGVGQGAPKISVQLQANERIRAREEGMEEGQVTEPGRPTEPSLRGGRGVCKGPEVRLEEAQQRGEASAAARGKMGKGTGEEDRGAGEDAWSLGYFSGRLRGTVINSVCFPCWRLTCPTTALHFLHGSGSRMHLLRDPS